MKNGFLENGIFEKSQNPRPATRGSPRRRAALNKIVVYRVPGTPGTAAFNGRGAEAFAVPFSISAAGTGPGISRPLPGTWAHLSVRHSLISMLSCRRLLCWTGICIPALTSRVSGVFLPPSAVRARESRPPGPRIPGNLN